MADKKELIEVLRTIILEIFPEFKGGYHFPIRAKVVKVYESGGRIGEFNKHYSVDVQPLYPDGSVNADAPIIPDVEIPVLWAGPSRGIYCLPTIGSIVRVGFYHYDPSQPYVDAVLGDGFNCPDHPAGSLIVQHSDGRRFEITEDGTVNITMDTTITGNTTIKGNTAIQGDTTIQGNLKVDGTIKATGDVSENQPL